jgi:pyrroline-5-carboxylate reductase
MKAIVFLGGGRITSALVAGLRLAGYRNPIIVHDRNPKKLKALQREHGVIGESDLRNAIRLARLLVIAVRPPSVKQLLNEIGVLDTAFTAVSLAAGIPLYRLRDRLGPSVRWARAMPSPVCRVGQGLTALAFDRGVSNTSRGEVKRLFQSVGEVLEIPESKFDAFTVTYSSSHGYHALATLAKAAQKAGLDRKTALSASAHALADGIQAWRKSRMSLESLLEEAATPGGIAATVMSSIDEDGYRGIVERGLKAGMRRAHQNAKR